MSGVAVATIVAGYLFFGVAIGSFLNVVIYRIPLGLSVISPPSRCSSCGYQLRPRDNVPIISYLLLRGRCRNCDVRFGISYLMIELLNLLIWSALLLRLGLTFLTPVEAIFASVLLVSSVIDIKTRTIPRKVIYAGVAVVLSLVTIDAIASRSFHVLGRALLAGALSFAVFFIIYVISRGSIGFGDVRLSFLIGFALGVYGFRPVIDFFYISFAAAAIYGISLILRSKGGRKTKIPFGPFMAIGAFLGLMFLDTLHILG